MPRRKPRDPERSPDLPHAWIERQIDRIAGFIYSDPLDIDHWEYRRTRMHGPEEYEFLGDWGNLNLGEEWGGHDTTGFFRKTVTVPETHAGEDTVLDICMDGGETQLFIDGRPYQGLDWHRSIVPIGEYAQSGRELELSMEAFIINYPYDERRQDQRDIHSFERARFLKRDRLIEDFVFDARFILENYLSYWEADDNLEIEGFLLSHLEEVARMCGPHITTAAEARVAAEAGRRYFKEKIFDSGAFSREGVFNICAQSHIDLVYLWPLKETFRKNARTATNMLSLMREYPEYKFSSSQPYLLEKMKEMYPETYKEIKQRVKEGKWEIIGATWVEPDGNLLGPESLVRQLLFGKKFLREEFGLEAETCWLPDVFGVMYTLPQILKKAGVKYFSTEKLNVWNDTNNFPHDTFRWRGPDGSEVLSHFAPTHFGQDYRAANLKKHWDLFREKQTVGENLFVYGWSDGGGGPTREMVESSLRSRSFPGLPKGRIDFAEEYFRRLDAKAEKLEVWDDELYMEGHRGTYTSKGDLKRQNRKAEVLYRDTETLSALASVFGGPRIQEELNRGWKYVLLNQFHDNLPGTHVPECVPSIKKDHASAMAVGEKVKGDVLDFIAGNLDTGAAGEDLMLFNTLSWERPGLVSLDPSEIPGGAAAVVTAEGESIPLQTYGDKVWVSVPKLPSLGWETISFTNKKGAGEDLVETASFDGKRLVTPLYIIDFDEAGNMAGLFDKVNSREILDGPGNHFQMFEDDPGRKFSAWDIAYHFEEFEYSLELVSGWELVCNGPHFAALKARWKVLDSVIDQELILYPHDGRIDFNTHVDWKNQKKLLKVAFPVKVRSKIATYDLPFGSIERATHKNTTWEKGKFEVCGHKWADLSEGDYGVALMNDCKYGYDIKENVMRLSLLRSPVRPDGMSDIMEHDFTYSLFPHKGTWRQACADRKAYELNMPVTARLLGKASASADAGQIPGRWSFMTPSGENVIVETLKQQEAGGGIVVRTFDSHGCHGKVEMEAHTEISGVDETNLLEEEAEMREMTLKNGLTAEYTPYEIKTHILKLSS